MLTEIVRTKSLVVLKTSAKEWNYSIKFPEDKTMLAIKDGKIKIREGEVAAWTLRDIAELAGKKFILKSVVRSPTYSELVFELQEGKEDA